MGSRKSIDKKDPPWQEDQHTIDNSYSNLGSPDRGFHPRTFMCGALPNPFHRVVTHLLSDSVGAPCSRLLSHLMLTPRSSHHPKEPIVSPIHANSHVMIPCLELVIPMSRRACRRGTWHDMASCDGFGCSEGTDFSSHHLVIPSALTNRRSGPDRGRIGHPPAGGDMARDEDGDGAMRRRAPAYRRFSLR